MTALWITAAEHKPCYVPVSTQSQHSEVLPMWKCCWPLPFFFAVPSRPLCRSAPHRIQLRWSVENIDSPGPPALGHLRLWESTAVSAPPKKHGSCSCLTQTYRTMLSVFTQTAQAREYINCGPHSHLDDKSLFWLLFLKLIINEIQSLLLTRCAEFSPGLKSASWVMQRDLLWLNAHSPNWISTSASSSPSCLDKRWWKISTPALIKEMGHFDPTLN